MISSWANMGFRAWSHRSRRVPSTPPPYFPDPYWAFGISGTDGWKFGTIGGASPGSPTGTAGWWGVIGFFGAGSGGGTRRVGGGGGAGSAGSAVAGPAPLSARPLRAAKTQARPASAGTIRRRGSVINAAIPSVGSPARLVRTSSPDSHPIVAHGRRGVTGLRCGPG